jgi:hypothetical protein
MCFRISSRNVRTFGGMSAALLIGPLRYVAAGVRARSCSWRDEDMLGTSKH